MEALQGLVQMRNQSGSADGDGHDWNRARAVLAQRFPGPRGESDESA